MEGRWIVACLVWGLVLEGVLGQTVPCMETRAECLATGYSSISIFNNKYRCCGPGYSMSVVNAQCSCTKTSEAMKCLKGPKACLNAPSLSSDGQGNTLCCPAGFGMSTQSSFTNGHSFTSCVCSRSMFGGGGSSFVTFGNHGMTSGTVNSTAMTERFQQWQQMFQSTMNHGMRALSNGMMSLAANMNNMRNQMASIFGNVFRG